MALAQRLESLKKRRAMLKAAIHDEERRPFPDPISLKLMKFNNLSMKDEIEWLSRSGAV